MSMRLGVIADLHLPDDPSTVKEVVFDWALAEAGRRKLDWLIGAGDLTACGTLPAARRIREKLDRCGVPFLLTPGNAEQRSRDDREATNALLQPSQSDVATDRPLLIDTSRRRIAADDIAKLENLNSPNPELAVITHCPPSSLPQHERLMIEQRLADGRIGLLITGHYHIDHIDGRCHLIRGIDPDKAAGGPPALTIFEFRDGVWRREAINCPEADPRLWSRELRMRWLEQLGFSAMSDPLGALEAAGRRGVPVVELRFSEVNDCSRGKLLERIGQWRQNGGRTLSCHLPLCSWREERLLGGGRMRRAVRLALELGCEHVSLKMPDIALKEMKQPRIEQELLRSFTDFLAPLHAAGVSVGFENFHMPYRHRPDEFRRFGCLPAECLEWVEAFRKESGNRKAGFQLDLGNARNNSPFSNQFTLSQWYSLTGHVCVGYHLHQVIRETQQEPMRNHSPMLTVFGRLLSLSSFFMSWERGILRPAPMILEIRDGRGAESYDAIRKELDF